MPKTRKSKKTKPTFYPGGNGGVSFEGTLQNGGFPIGFPLKAPTKGYPQKETRPSCILWFNNPLEQLKRKCRV